MPPKPMLTAEQIARLGTDYDSVLAAEFGCTAATVSRTRRLHGIPSFEKRKCEPVTVVQLRLMGKDTDDRIGKIIGIPAEYVRRLRVEFHIPRFSPPGYRSRRRGGKKASPDNAPSRPPLPGPQQAGSQSGGRAGF